MSAFAQVSIPATAPGTAFNSSTTAGANLSDGAEEPALASKNLLGIIRDGGLVIYPLLGCSFILLVFAFERFISLRTGRVIPRPFVKRFMHQLQEGQLDRDEARLVCEENGSPTALIFAAAVRKWGRPAVEVEQAVIDAGERACGNLRRYLRVFSGLGTIGPLLGLLGTVFGIIRAFGDIAMSESTGRTEMLSHGISEALVLHRLWFVGGDSGGGVAPVLRQPRRSVGDSNRHARARSGEHNFRRGPARGRPIAPQ